MPDFLTFLCSVISGGFTAAALVWLAKNWISERLKNAIKHEYDAKLETHKIQLKCEADAQLEHLKSELQIAAAERNVRYSRIFERTAEVIAEIYSKLLQFHAAVLHYTSPVEFPTDGPKEARRKTVVEKHDAFLDSFRPNRLFLPKHTANQINDFANRLSSLSRNFMCEVEMAGSRYDKADTVAWEKIYSNLTKDVPPLLELLEDDFRELLGTARKEETHKNGLAITSPPPENATAGPVPASE